MLVRASCGLHDNLVLQLDASDSRLMVYTCYIAVERSPNEQASLCPAWSLPYKFSALYSAAATGDTSLDCSTVRSRPAVPRASAHSRPKTTAAKQL